MGHQIIRVITRGEGGLTCSHFLVYLFSGQQLICFLVDFHILIFKIEDGIEKT